MNSSRDSVYFFFTRERLLRPHARPICIWQHCLSAALADLASAALPTSPCKSKLCNKLRPNNSEPRRPPPTLLQTGLLVCACLLAVEYLSSVSLPLRLCMASASRRSRPSSFHTGLICTDGKTCPPRGRGRHLLARGALGRSRRHSRIRNDWHLPRSLG